MLCYDNVKEFETSEQFTQHQESYPYDLTIQGLIARERIYQNRYISLEHMYTKPSRINDDVTTMDEEQMNVKFIHFLHLFNKNNDYLYFSHIFLRREDSLFRRIAKWNLDSLKCATLIQLIETATVSCEKIQQKIKTETRLSSSSRLLAEFRNVSITAAHLILKLSKRKSHCHLCRATQEKNIALGRLLQELLQHASEKNHQQTSKSLFESSLPHELARSPPKPNAQILRYDEYLPYNPEFVKLLIDAGFDLNATNRDGDTLLHIAVQRTVRFFDGWDEEMDSHLEKLGVQTIDLLLERGAYLHARNQWKKTVLDMVLVVDIELGNEVNEAIAEVLQKYNHFPTLKQLGAIKIKESGLSFEDFLPKSLVKFVNLH